ncbi:similar to Saccharomyces cerevisiae YAL034C FUN19 Non-essential protein of unknown function [Maudiozyma barnettii]|uniref:SWIRM domain-containing protein n=1 Tax=Maudiozyma barnettii TaxID=61262 RepID=A0A8H2VH61_9SACH|nr:uncharacterized protein KABA2_06S02882 [Kazachstania barnettii]CAB4255325.1 similar to Saccharomyces cerevisiae YAL034C FUN19 Non-essential protein of unknown function [Kazachstania barnettii]CAD1783731.1 similar to Saccharomyces cerevisiae YAL034C FUN19 Non-essential protein of unknown function [Kazachstania barnettii]
MTNQKIYKNQISARSSPSVYEMDFPGFVPVSKKNYGSDSDTSNLTSTGMTFPSPPLSPKLNNLDGEKDERKLSLNLDSLFYKPNNTTTTIKTNSNEKKVELMVKPVWVQNTTTKQYIHSTRKFLQEYKFSNMLKNNVTKTSNFETTPQYMFRTRKNNMMLSPSGTEGVIPLRVMTLQHRHTHNKSKSTKRMRYSTGYSHANTQRPIASAINHAQHLASSTAVTEVPQYVPNMSWNKLKDYSPPLSSIPNDNLKALKIEWKGSPMDLSRDPLKDHLHPAELVLAQILRLPCDLYLDSKRRLFLEKVYRLKKGMQFRRTDAQKACRIDVNKASRLFAAFEKVGWLKDSNFTKYL